MLKSTRFFIVFILLAIHGVSLSWAQGIVIKDTLNASRIVELNNRRNVGVYEAGLLDLRNTVSPTGEPDYIKYIQTLPGVSSGADGSSSLYVRGGNIGGNVITLDGVPVYGASHFLGFMSVVPARVVEKTEFQVGGFGSDISNLTSSIIRLWTADGSFDKWQASGSLSTFMFGANASGPIVRDRASIVIAARYSPLGYTFGLIDNKIPDINDLSTVVYDLYGKFSVKLFPGHNLSLTFFNSKDDYRFSESDSMNDHIGWSNSIGYAQWNGHFSDKFTARAEGYWSSRYSLQEQEKTVAMAQNFFSVRDSLQEASLKAQVEWSVSDRLSLKGGSQWRLARFNPGSSFSYIGQLGRVEKTSRMSDNHISSNTWMIHSQANYQNGNLYQFRASVRLSLHRTDGVRGKSLARGEYGLLGRCRLAEWIGIECTVDRLVQFYHTLEGLPLGWSLDMVIPSDKDFAPESARQVYGGAYGHIANHRWNLGLYWKWMDNIMYFADGGDLFKATLSSWRAGVYSGRGRSYGLEANYEYQGRRLDARLAFTLSKSDRQFSRLNGGRWFPAKFDRRNMLNISADYVMMSSERTKIGATTLLSLQSGCWETVPIGHYSIPGLINERIDVDLYSAINNYRMPAFFRWDVGLYMDFKASRISHRLILGVYNITNHHNPFVITYDGELKEWRQVSLLPIMPSLSYNVFF